LGRMSFSVELVLQLEELMEIFLELERLFCI
jgi:hypothetical protein